MVKLSFPLYNHKT